MFHKLATSFLFYFNVCCIRVFISHGTGDLSLQGIYHHICFLYSSKCIGLSCCIKSPDSRQQRHFWLIKKHQTGLRLPRACWTVRTIIAPREFHSTVQPSLSAPFSKLTKACGESDTVSLLLPGQIRLESRLRLCSSAFASVLSFTSNLNLLRLIINMHKNRVSDDHGLHTWVCRSSPHEPLKATAWEKVGRGQSSTVKPLGIVRHWPQKHQSSFRLLLLVFQNVEYWSTGFSLQAADILFHPPAWGSGAAGPRVFLSDATEKKPQQCALLSAPSRGVQQPSTSTELFCLILLCRLCLSSSQRLKHKRHYPKDS